MAAEGPAVVANDFDKGELSTLGDLAELVAGDVTDPVTTTTRPCSGRAVPARSSNPATMLLASDRATRKTPLES
jgi:hypothetical protein